VLPPTDGDKQQHTATHCYTLQHTRKCTAHHLHALLLPPSDDEKKRKRENKREKREEKQEKRKIKEESARAERKSHRDSVQMQATENTLEGKNAGERTER